MVGFWEEQMRAQAVADIEVVVDIEVVADDIGVVVVDMGLVAADKVGILELVVDRLGTGQQAVVERRQQIEVAEQQGLQRQ